MVVQSSIGKKSKSLRILDDQKRGLKLSGHRVRERQPLGRLAEYIEVQPLFFFWAEPGKTSDHLNFIILRSGPIA